MNIEKAITKIIDGNNWLNGLYDYRDGDIMAIVNQPEKFSEYTEVKDLKQLYENLRNYEGTFKHDKLLFFNDFQYGCFVYRIDKTDNYIEHLSVHIMSFENFAEVVKELNTLKDCDSCYWSNS